MKNCVVAASIAVLKWYLSQRINKDSHRKITCCMILPHLVGVNVCLHAAKPQKGWWHIRHEDSLQKKGGDARFIVTTCRRREDGGEGENCWNQT